MDDGPFRLPPAMPVGAYQTFSINSPLDTTIRSACEDVQCEAYRLGWESHIDESDAIGQRRGRFIRFESGRTFQEMRTAAGITVFRFPSGQRCFADHKTRPEVYVVRDGDWRGNPTGRRRQHERPADWVEDFGEHQLRVAEQTERG